MNVYLYACLKDQNTVCKEYRPSQMHVDWSSPKEVVVVYKVTVSRGQTSQQTNHAMTWVDCTRTVCDRLCRHKRCMSNIPGRLETGVSQLNCVIRKQTSSFLIVNLKHTVKSELVSQVTWVSPLWSVVHASVDTRLDHSRFSTRPIVLSNVVW